MPRWSDFAHSQASQQYEQSAEAEWTRYLANEANQFTALTSYDQENLSQIIKNAGGQIDVPVENPIVEFAKSNWWQFSVSLSTDGRLARITENNYLLYGGLGVAALLLIVIFGSR